MYSDSPEKMAQAAQELIVEEDAAQQQQPAEEEEAGDGQEEPELLSRLWTTKVVEFPRELVQARRGPAIPPSVIFGDADADKNPLMGRIGGMYADAIESSASSGAREEQEETEQEAFEREDRERLAGRDETKRILRQGDNTALRSNALFVTSKEIANLNTKQILATVGHAFSSAKNPLARTNRDIAPKALEWVNDESIVLLFDTEDSALQAFYELTTRELDPESPLDWQEILTLPEELEPFFVRAALGSDVKAKDAAQKSQFYANERREHRHARRGASKPYDRNYRTMGKRGHGDAFEEYLDQRKNRRKTTTDVDDLDAELEAYQRAGEEGNMDEQGIPSEAARD